MGNAGHWNEQGEVRYPEYVTAGSLWKNAETCTVTYTLAHQLNHISFVIKAKFADARVLGDHEYSHARMHAAARQLPHWPSGREESDPV